MSNARTAGAAAPAWATAQTAPVSERLRSGGAFTDAEEARIREKVLNDKKTNSVWMILGLILLLIVIFALLWFFFRSCSFGCGGCGGPPPRRGCCNKCGKKKNKCSCGGGGGSGSESEADA